MLLAPADDTHSPAPPHEADSALDSLVPKISDFGLAKRLDEDVGQTQTGAIVGTPSYMAPEQAAAGGLVGPPADIYALGAILYELVTGRPPFKGPSALETLELVRHADPTSPAQLQPGCPRDLETICLKCLRKDPAGRYPSAAALADDLQRFLDGAPIQARPVGAVERMGKWLRRRPAVAASIGLGSLAALAVVALAVRLVYSWELEDANRKLGEAAGAREAALVVADEAQVKLDVALERERALHYVHNINLAQREWQTNHVGEACRILDACPLALRHWEWHYLYRQCHAETLTIRGHVGDFTALAVCATGDSIAAASVLREPGVTQFDLKIWDAASGQLAMDLAVTNPRTQVTSLAFNTDGTLLASAGIDNLVRIWEVKTGKERYRIKVSNPAYRMAFSPDGTRLAAAVGAQIRFFDAGSGTDLFTLSGHRGTVRALALSADGRWLVSGGTDGLVKLWDLATGKEVFSRGGNTGIIVDVAFSPKQDHIVSCARPKGNARREIRLWNAADGSQSGNTIILPFEVGAAVFTANPEQIACACGDGSIRFLDVSTGETTFVLHGHGAALHRLAVTPDGSRVVTGSPDRTIRVWPVRHAEFVEVPLSVPVHMALALSGDGSRLAWSDYKQFAAQSGDGFGIRVAPVPPAAKGALDIRPTKLVVALAFTPDNRNLACAEQNGVDLIDLDNARVARVIAEFGVWDLSISPDGQYLATATRHPGVNPDPVVVRELAVEMTGSTVKLPVRQPVPAIKIWRAADGSLVRTLAGQMSVAFSPDGWRLAGAKDSDVVVWDAATGTELRTLIGPTEPVLKVQFAAGGRQVVGFTRHQATVWDADTGRTIATVGGLNGPAFITPDGRRIVGTSGVGLNSGIKWWDVKLGVELLFLPLPDGSARQHALALSADGRRVATSASVVYRPGISRLVLWEGGPP
ncbi:MAG TPA: protein kinase [Gemmataceae bacterium]|nr:protein kinase [Gemmataceae bacterium]